MRHKEWHVCFLPLLPHLQGRDEHSYEHFNQAKAWAHNQIDDWVPWCKRYNPAGLLVLDDLKSTIASTEGWFWQGDLETERVMEGVLDEHTGTTIRVRIRRTKP